MSRSATCGRKATRPSASTPPAFRTTPSDALFGGMDTAVGCDDPGQRLLQVGHRAQAAGMGLGRADVGDHGDVDPPGGHAADDVVVGQVVVRRVDQRDGGAGTQAPPTISRPGGIWRHTPWSQTADRSGALMRATRITATSGLPTIDRSGAGGGPLSGNRGRRPILTGGDSDPRTRRPRPSRMTSDAGAMNDRRRRMPAPTSQRGSIRGVMKKLARRLGEADPQVHAPHGHRVRRRRRGRPMGPGC